MVQAKPSWAMPATIILLFTKIVTKWREVTTKIYFKYNKIQTMRIKIHFLINERLNTRINYLVPEVNWNALGYTIKKMLRIKAQYYNTIHEHGWPIGNKNDIHSIQ